MKHLVLSCGAALVLAGACFVAAQDKPKSSPAADKAKAAADKSKAPAKTPAKAAPAQPAQPTPPAATKRSPEEEAVGQLAQALVKAYNQRDAKAFAGAFTAEGEYIDETGAMFHGRPAIEAEFARFFEANPTTSMQVQLNSTRAVAAGVLAADGSTQFTRAKDQPAVSGHCSLICTRDGKQWLIASLRETQATGQHASPHEQLKQLEWLVGEWIDEGAQSHVHFSCRWDDGGNFLLRDFEVHSAGQKTITGTQRIGYDPLSSHLKSWVFDSAGGYAEGFWQQDGDSWILISSGVTSEGQLASGSSIYNRVGPNRISFHAVDRVVGGQRVPDVLEVVIVRKPPGPTARSK